MTTRTVYSNDEDLQRIRPNILQFGVADWTDQHEEAFRQINRALISRWYRQAVADRNIDYRETEFDPDNVDISQVLRLSCYKTLELAYLYLMKDAPDPDAFERQMKLFQKLYFNELDEVLAIGINYDWDEDNSIASDEKYDVPNRTLLRM